MSHKGKILIIGGAETNACDSKHYKSDLLESIFPKLNCRSITIITQGGKGLFQVKKKYINVFESIAQITPEFVVLREKKDNEKIIFLQRLQKAEMIFFSGETKSSY